MESTVAALLAFEGIFGADESFSTIETNARAQCNGFAVQGKYPIPGR
jgi:hypothetical protein